MVGNCATNAEIEGLKYELETTFATKNKVQLLKDSIQDFVAREEFNIL